MLVDGLMKPYKALGLSLSDEKDLKLRALVSKQCLIWWLLKLNTDLTFKNEAPPQLVDINIFSLVCKKSPKNPKRGNNIYRDKIIMYLIVPVLLNVILLDLSCMAFHLIWKILYVNLYYTIFLVSQGSIPMISSL